MPANVCLAYFKPGQDVTVQATENLTGKTFVAAAPGGRGTLPNAATASEGGAALGVAGHDVTEGGHVHVNVAGIVPVTAGAAITADTQISVGDNGTAVPAGTGGDATVVVGYATTNAASGADVAVLLK